MPGSKCQIVVLAGKTGHFTDIIKNKKRGGKQMNKTPKINRLFLVTVIWIRFPGFFWDLSRLFVQWMRRS